MPNLSNLLADDLADHTVDLLRVSAQTNREVVAILEELQHDIVSALQKSDLSAAKTRRLQALQKEVNEAIRSAYSELSKLHVSQLYELAKVEQGAVTNIVNTLIGVDLVQATSPLSLLRELVTNALIQGAPSKQWWSRQAGDIAFRFSLELRKGIAAGESNADLVARVLGTDAQPGLLNTSKRAAEALVRTSVQTVANLARLEVFKENSDVIDGVQQVSTLDDRTTDICMAYDLQSWDFDGTPIRGSTLPFVDAGGNAGPPRHWNCRSVLIPLLKSWQELGLDINDLPPETRAAMDGQVAAGTNYNEWLKSKSRVEQDRVLGKGKADLWRAGKISLTDLLDQKGNPLTLAELSRKHRRSKTTA